MGRHTKYPSLLPIWTNLPAPTPAPVNPIDEQRRNYILVLVRALEKQFADTGALDEALADRIESLMHDFWPNEVPAPCGVLGTALPSFPCLVRNAVDVPEGCTFPQCQCQVTPDGALCYGRGNARVLGTHVADPQRQREIAAACAEVFGWEKKPAAGVIASREPQGEKP